MTQTAIAVCRQLRRGKFYFRFFIVTKEFLGGGEARKSVTHLRLMHSLNATLYYSVSPSSEALFLHAPNLRKVKVSISNMTYR